MPYILGAFGVRCNKTCRQKLTHIASQHIDAQTLELAKFEHGIILAGYKPQQEYHYNHIIPLASKQGILVGKIFDRNHHPAQFNNEHIHACMTDPGYLSSHYWGRYVGALFNQAIQTLTLVRDPQGLSTLFYHVTADGILFSNELVLLYEALEIKPSIDVSYFAQHLIHTNQALSSTPFENIRELLPSMTLSYNINGSCTQKLLWNPESLHGPMVCNENEFEEELLTTLRGCTKAWIGDVPGVCVELSGGTDSSGVMLLLHDVLPADKKLIAVNYIDSKTPGSNEIAYAQETADACSAPLHFLDWQTTSILDKLPHNFFPNRPNTFLLSENLRKQLHAVAIDNGCPELMNGQGGDHVFCSPPPKHALADYVLQCGLRGCTHPLQELSGAYRAPWPSIINNNIKAVGNFYRKRHSIEPYETAHLNKHFLQELTQEPFYLNETLKKIYPGKAMQIASICHAVAYAERDQTAPTMCRTHPLISQPIIELALQIPTYQSFKDGYDRIFFRRAVSRIKKITPLWRRIKGHTTGSMSKQFAHHASEIRDIILNGKLAAKGIINTHWVATEITKMHHSHTENLWPILHLLTSELWFNQWHL